VTQSLEEFEFYGILYQRLMLWNCSLQLEKTLQCSMILVTSLITNMHIMGAGANPPIRLRIWQN